MQKVGSATTLSKAREQGIVHFEVYRDVIDYGKIYRARAVVYHPAFKQNKYPINLYFSLKSACFEKKTLKRNPWAKSRS